MRVLAIAAVLIACGGRPKHEPITGNAPPSQPPKTAPKGATSFRIEMVPSPTGLAMHAVLREKANNEPLLGATVVLTSPAISDEQVNISDEYGRVSFTGLPPGEYTMTLYYSNSVDSGKFDIEQGKIAKVTVHWVPNEKQNETITISADQPAFKSALDALRAGAVEQAAKLGAEELAKKPTTQLQGATAIAHYAFAFDTLHARAFPSGSNNQPILEIRDALVRFTGELDQVQTYLAAAASDGKFSLELCVACMLPDPNYINGYLLSLPPTALDIERDRAGQPLPADDKRRRPTYRFDHGDLAWGRAAVHFQQALANFALAYDWSDLATKIDADKPKQIVFKLTDRARIVKAKEHFLAGLKASDEARLAFVSETDDDREWVPNPKQKSYASPLVVDDKLYATWKQVVDEARVLVDGKTGVSLRAVWAAVGSFDPPPGFLDVGAMLAKPKDIVLEVELLVRMDRETDPAKRAKLAATIMKSLLGNGYQAKMTPSPISDRLLQLRTSTNAGETFEDKVKYVLWL